MDWSVIATTVGISAVTSGLVSLLVYKYQKKTDYIFEYRKFILSKRQQAYSKAEKVIGGLTSKKLKIISTPMGNSRELMVPGFFELGTVEEMRGFVNDLVGVVNRGYWISDKLYKHLQEANRLVIDIHSEILHPENPDDLAETFERRMYEVDKVADALSETYFRDICQLDDITLFKKKKHFY